MTQHIAQDALSPDTRRNRLHRSAAFPAAAVAHEYARQLMPWARDVVLAPTEPRRLTPVDRADEIRPGRTAAAGQIEIEVPASAIGRF